MRRAALLLLASCAQGTVPIVPSETEQPPAESFARLLSTQCALTTDGDARCWDPKHPVSKLQTAGRLADLGPVRDFFMALDEVCFVLEPSGLCCFPPEGEKASDLERIFAGRPVIASDSDATSTCVIVKGEGPWCWRYLDVINQLPPERIFHVEGASGVETIGAGTHRFVGLDAEGHAYFWGIDGGTFGNGTVDPAADHRHASLGAGGMRFRSIDVYNDTCGIDLDGALWCWGKTPDSAPRKMATPPGEIFTHVKKSVDVTGIVAASGKVYIWGDTLANQIGAGKWGISDQLEVTPAMLPADTTIPFVELAVSDFAPAMSPNASCALSADGQLYCWGRPYDYGWWDRDLTRVVTEPVAIALDAPVATLTVRAHSSCVVDTTGATWCWGNNALDGMLPDEARLFVPTPTLRTTFEPAPPRCQLDADGAAWCTGRAIDHVAPGEHGGPGREVWTSPTRVAPSIRWRQIVLFGEAQLCGITFAGEILCLGDGATSPINLSERADQMVSVNLENETPRQLELLGEIVCARTESSAVRCFGAPRYRAVRSSFALIAPAPIVALSSQQKRGRICATDADPGRWWCASSASAGETLVLAEEMITPPLRDLQFGDGFACGFSAPDRVACYGDDDFGRLGRGAPAEFVRPTFAAGWHGDAR